MTRVFGDPVDVWVSDGRPVRFVWRGRLPALTTVTFPRFRWSTIAAYVLATVVAYLSNRLEVGIPPLHGIVVAVAAVPEDNQLPLNANIRYARLPVERAQEWVDRINELIMEFADQPRGGDVTFGFVMGIYPTDRGRLPDQDEPALDTGDEPS
jgi:hypothetical protein